MDYGFLMPADPMILVPDNTPCGLESFYLYFFIILFCVLFLCVADFGTVRTPYVVLQYF